MWFPDRRLKVLEIVGAMSLSHHSLILILNDKFGIRKLCANWVLLQLTIQNKFNGAKTSQYLALFNRIPENCMGRFLTVDETWIQKVQHTRNHAKLETVNFSVQIDVERSQSECVRQRKQTTLIWVACGLIHNDYLEKERITNGKYYGNLLDRFSSDLKKINRVSLNGICTSTKTKQVIIRAKVELNFRTLLWSNLFYTSIQFMMIVTF